MSNKADFLKLNYLFSYDYPITFGERWRALEEKEESDDLEDEEKQEFEQMKADTRQRDNEVQLYDQNDRHFAEDCLKALVRWVKNMAFKKGITPDGYVGARQSLYDTGRLYEPTDWERDDLELDPVPELNVADTKKMLNKMKLMKLEEAE